MIISIHKKNFKVRQCLDRNMKYKKCIIGHFFDLMITLRASIWSPFGHHFGVPPIACAISGEKWEVHGEGLKVASLLENGSKLSPEKNRLLKFQLFMNISAREVEAKNAPKLLFWALGEKLIWIQSYVFASILRIVATHRNKRECHTMLLTDTMTWNVVLPSKIRQNRQTRHS